MCKSLQRSHPGTTEEITSFSIDRLRDPKPSNFEDDNLPHLLEKYSPWTSYGQLLEEFAEQKVISFYWLVPRPTLAKRYLVPIHKKL